ncbi:uncharacterized protein LOC130677392 [Microplitis mediator]|uniref:uncharacterized protein LOC130677392 n=1 Tax=Microplitis mediator TaxID=375433 RepID=UPI002554E99A|nr:uncharacterized protein LOC130677392 [Microplitis mediator]
MINYSYSLKYNLLIIFLISLLVIESSYGSTSVARVNAGKQATLLCQSNDDNHRFMFWKVIDNHNNIVGPNSSYDNDKYNYEVLTGKLYIWSVSTRESGFYHCISRSIENHSKFNVHTIELIVNKNDYYWESDFEVTLLRTLMVIMLVLVGIALYLLVTTKRKRKPDIEDSRSFKSTKDNVPIITYSRPETPSSPQGCDNDFPQVYNQLNKDQLV